MLNFAIATRNALLIVREGTVEQQLKGLAPVSISLDEADPTRLYVGTWANGLWRSADSARTWEQVGSGIPHAEITAVAVERAGDSHPGVIYVGTEPSTLSRSEDGGETWHESTTLIDLPSATRWAFPPKPETHHVRWIEVDPIVQGKLYVAIEVGALVRSTDGGDTWQDRVPGGPIDTHTAATHPSASGRLYSAAGDGYFESDDGGDSRSRPMDGLQHRYLVGVAVDPGNPDTMVVSGAAGPYVAYRPTNAEAYVYRKSSGQPFERAMDGLPDGQGTVASRIATHADETGIFYAATNHGLFRSKNGGMSWKVLEIAWPDGAFRSGVDALVAFAE